MFKTFRASRHTILLRLVVALVLSTVAVQAQRPQPSPTPEPFDLADEAAAWGKRGAELVGQLLS